MIRKLIVTSALLVAIPFAAQAAVAPADDDVRFTVHNMSYNTDQTKGLTNNGAQRTWYAVKKGANQVCVFCHTPHNATRNSPLWNRVANTGITYRMYTSSGSLSSTAKNAVLTSSNESVLCLSCHDGKTAMNVLHSSSYRDNSAVGDAIIDMGYGAVAVEMGRLAMTGAGAPSDLGATRDSSGAVVDGKAGYNLSDDHPIGFKYTDAVAGNSGYKPLASVDPSIRFFGPNRDRVECSSCHDPHKFYGYIRSGGTRLAIEDPAVTNGAVTSTQAQKDRTPFLVRNNNGSALCLGCHIK